MIQYSMEFYTAKNRNTINLMNHSEPITESIKEVFKNILGFMIFKDTFVICLPNQPLRGDLSKLGKAIAEKDCSLDILKTINKNGNNLFRKKN